MKVSLKNFIFDNKFKSMTIRAYIYSAIFRLQIRFLEPKKMRKKWGEEGKESQMEESREVYKYAASVSRIVDRICSKAPWESKCLVRALTAQKILKKKGIHSTMYLGCGLNEGKMVAHAWLRCGKMYVTGGDGAEYSIVDKFFC